MSKGGRCSGYLKCRTVEAINGVACVTKEFVHALEVHVHVVRALDETTPAAFRREFSDARGNIELWLCEKDGRYFPIRPEDAVDTRLAGIPARWDINGFLGAFEV